MLYKQGTFQNLTGVLSQSTHCTLLRCIVALTRFSFVLHAIGADLCFCRSVPTVVHTV